MKSKRKITPKELLKNIGKSKEMVFSPRLGRPVYVLFQHQPRAHKARKTA
jgi:hypothetical protein